MSNALSSINVVDFGQYIAGPVAAMLLADQGAQVTRVDPPGGPVWDTPASQTWNRGKRRISLDLKKIGDLEVARGLMVRADVVIENFRPGVMDRLGLGAIAMTAVNPGLIYCSLPGFATDDPRAEMRGWEGVVGAAAATYRARLEAGDDGRPVYTAIPISSMYAAFLGATSIAAALVARERDGRGQRIEVPLFDATFTAMGVVGQKFADGRPARVRGGMAWVRQYQCKDGRWVQFHAANSRFVQQFVKAAGVDWSDEGLTDRQRMMDHPELEGVLLERMKALFLTRTAQEWEDLVNAAGTPTAICRETEEWLDHPHARKAGMVIEMDYTVQGRSLQAGVTPRLETTPSLRPEPARAADADGAAIRDELSKASGEAARPESRADDRASLAGVKVLDLCIILAGPTCGRTLAEFGADVIKIDAPGREGGVAFHHDVNRGKRSLLLDLGRPEGIEVFWRLVEDADVVVQNYRAGVVERLGIGYGEVRKRKPEIIYASLNAYGHDGPWEGRPGWEQLAQAATGMQMRFGGDHPVLQPFPVNDYGTGVLGAYGVLLALHERSRTGNGQEVRSALAYTACLLQSPYLARYKGKRWDEARGQSSLGESPLQRLYEASDGWFFLGARKGDQEALGRVEGLQGVGDCQGEAVEAALEVRFRSATAAEWVSRLVVAGIAAQTAVSPSEVMEDPWVVAHGLSLTREHDGVGLARTNGPGQRLYRTAVVPGAAASVPGADAPAVLAEYGLGERLEGLVARGVVAIEPSD